MPSLKTYYARRDFSKTGEPRGRKRAAKGNSYVIQKHAATRLHYDLRLELDGVMLSWAVTRGPSLVPGDKRLAIRVEDHPIEYNEFEGTIPEGQYGAGTVMIWDRGKWFPEGDPHKGLTKGHLDFSLEGENLKGRWHLVRMRRRPGERQEPWLLIKSADEYARRARDPDILEEADRSVATGRSMEEIAAANDSVWHSDRTPKDQPQARLHRPTKSRPRTPQKAVPRKTKAAKKKAESDLDPATIEGARKKAMPRFVPPSLATLANNAPDNDEWVHEIKFDGYRMQGRLSANRATLFTRHGLDWTERFAPIARALEGLPADNLIVDGEIVVQDARGISSFSALQETLKSGKGDFLYYVFDLLYLDGYDLTGAAFIDRKGALQQLCVHVPKGSAIIVSEHFDTAGPVLLKHACEMGLEGIISKKVHAQYHSGRVGDWLKIKCAASQEFIVAGYEPSDTGARTIRSLILGYYEGGQMRYAGRVGTGFTVAVERDLMTKVRPLVNNTMPFEKLPEEERRRKVRWLEPKLVAEIEFRGWTHGNVLRQASFKGLREDKPAREVVREKMMRVAAPQRKTAQPSGAPGVSSAAPFVARSRSVSVAGVALTHPDRVYWDDVGITKQMLAEYYEQVWDWIAPHLVDRPLALVRCPEGTAGECFFQKHASGGLEYAKLRRIPATGDEPWIAVETLQGLIGLAQAGVLEIHTWGTVADEMHTCNRLVFDLDPGPGVTWEQLKTGVRELRDVLGSDKLTSFLKATGGKGLHVVVPIAPTPWDEAKNFAHAVALAMARDDPRRFTANMAKRVRDNRIFVDYLRNDEGATAIAPYSTRARPGATIAVPLSWDELGRLEGPNTYNVLNIMKRLGRKRSDPWKDISRLRQKVPNGKAPKR